MSSVTINNSGKIHDTVKFLGSGTVVVKPGAQIRHYSIIEMDNGYLEVGNNSVLGFFTMVQGTGRITIGENSLIGPHCTLLASYHPESSDPQIQKRLVRGTLQIGNNVWSGANVVFNCDIIVWDNCIIGANSFVNKNVDENCVVAGSPAKFIRYKV